MEPHYNYHAGGCCTIPIPLRNNGQANPVVLQSEYRKELYYESIGKGNPERKFRIQQALEGLGYKLVHPKQVYRTKYHTILATEVYFEKDTDNEIEFLNTKELAEYCKKAFFKNGIPK